MKTGKRAAAAPSGLPGEQQQARERRAERSRKLGNAFLSFGAWACLMLIVGPTGVPLEVPQLGPAPRDLVASADFDDLEPVPDLAARQALATAQVPVHYAFDREAAPRRIDALRAAFRLVRPRWRLYLAERDRLVAEATGGKTATEPRQRHTGEPRPGKNDPPGHQALRTVNEPTRRDGAGGSERAAPPLPSADDLPLPEAVRRLDLAIEEELNRLRPEFEALLAVKRSELNGEVFPALRKAGFAEEIELLLSDVVQVLLSQRIVRDLDRFEDDLGRGVLDVAGNSRHDRSTARATKLLDVEGTQRQAEEYVAEFVKQKKPSRFDDPVLQAAVKAMARSMVDTTFARDMAATALAEDKARSAVPQTRLVRYTRGQALVKRGEVVTPKVQERIARMQAGTQDGTSPRSYMATGLILAVALSLFAGFASRHLHHFRYRPRDGHLLAAILLVHAMSLRLLLSLGEFVLEPGGSLTPVMWAVALPFALGPTLATLFLRPFTAAPFSLLCAVVTAVMAHNTSFLRQISGLDTLVVLQALVLGLAGVHAARHFRQRSDLVLGAAAISGVAVLCAASVALFTAPLGSDLFDAHNGVVLTMGVASGVISYLLLAALTPIFESLFNRLTDIKLLELTSMNHPALRQLATETPGTFTHSVMVGNLAQAGCDAIGANGLLARVGAYYHDLGKTRNPRFFAENQLGENPHDKLKPHLSALIIKSHVKDGIKLLKTFGLPDEIIDFVPQHHGTSLIAHFYHRAQREAVETGEEVNEADFRYPGPKPQRRETALLMLADSVEAAAKAMPDPNPLRVQALVKKIIAGKLEDGQFDECDLTLRELALVEKAFVRAVVGIHHTRPVYLPPLQTGIHAAHHGHAHALEKPEPGQTVQRLPAVAREGEAARLALLAETPRKPLAMNPAHSMTQEVDVRQGHDNGEGPHAPTAVLAHTQPGHSQPGHGPPRHGDSGSPITQPGNAPGPQRPQAPGRRAG